MGLFRSVGVVGVVGAVVFAGLAGFESALADQSLYAVGTLSTGFSNNVLGVPETEGVGVTSDAFAQINPGVIYRFDTPRTRVSVGYVLAARLFLRRDEANSLTNSLTVQAARALSRVSEADARVRFTAGRVNAFDDVPEGTPIDQVPNGDISFARIGANANYRRELSSVWSYGQGIEASAVTPTDETTDLSTSWTVGTTANAARRWSAQRLSGGLRVNYTRINRTGADGQAADDDVQLRLGPEVGWAWDINRRFSTSVEAGFDAVFRPDDFGERIVSPRVVGRLGYFYARKAVSLSYSHQITTNTLVAETNSVDRVELRGSYRLPWVQDLSVAGAVGAQRGRLVDLEASDLTETSDALVADVAVAWRQRDGIAWSLRYQYVTQDGGLAVDDGPNQLDRQEIQLSLAIQYPSPRALETERRQRNRVDGGRQDDGTEF